MSVEKANSRSLARANLATVDLGLQAPLAAGYSKSATFAPSMLSHSGRIGQTLFSLAGCPNSIFKQSDNSVPLVTDSARNFEIRNLSGELRFRVSIEFKILIHEPNLILIHLIFTNSCYSSFAAEAASR